MITIPNEVKIFITFLVSFVVVQGMKAVAKLFGKDVGGKPAAVTAVAVGAVFFFADGLLALVPADKVEIVSTTLEFIGVILGMFGTHYVYKNI